MRIIVNSDDFGLSVAVNEAILNSINAGMLTDTTMLVNKEGFDDAVQKIASHQVFHDKIGLHINLTDGKPLTDGIKKCARFCNADGMYIYTRSTPVWSLLPNEKKAIYTEVKAQIERCKTNNIKLTHIDSHHHVHTEWGILNVCLHASREAGINKVRLSRNIGGGISKVKQLYKSAFNFYIKNIAGFKTTQYFGDVDDMEINRPLPPNAILELMVHAMYGDNGQIVDYNQKSLFEQVSRIISGHQLISYSQL